MSYVETMVAAVPNANKDAYIAHARTTSDLLKEHGALQVLESWGDDVPDGKVTAFKRAVQAQADETVVVGFIVWPDKATREAAWAKIMQDNRMSPQDMPFDGKRMIYGGFEVVVEG
jgi:uncharacterized protein YbaA (DUF1428 family)